MALVTLTPDQIATLKQAEQMLHDLLPAIDGLEQCDFNCQQLRQQNEQIRNQITKLHSQFGGMYAGQSPSR